MEESFRSEIKKTIITPENSYEIWSDLKKTLPRAADLLGVSPENLYILNYNEFPGAYLRSKYRDTAVSCSGILEDMPFISKHGFHSARQEGYGLILYKSQLDPKIKYVLLLTKNQNYHDWDTVYMFVPKGKVFKLLRNAQKLNKLACKMIEPPVLQDGMLDQLVQNTIGFLCKAREIKKYGVRIRRGIVLDGVPGCGKTMACRYIQKLCVHKGIRWGSITSADIDKAYQDKKLDDLFQQWELTFFDDIDISYLNRKSGNGKMACSLLTAMDGMKDTSNVVRIFTTNEKVSDLDPAFTRPGRIDKFITFEMPDYNLRKKLIDKWPDNMRNHIDIPKLLKASEKFSFADLEAIRSFLVTNFLFGEKQWNLDKALDEFHERKEEKAKYVGFTPDLKVEK